MTRDVEPVMLSYMHVSLLVTDALIVDGTGAQKFMGSVAISQDTIVYSGPHDDTISADMTISLNGAFLSPGFIDMHGHSDLHVLRGSGMREKIAQGITTEVSGNCGMGVFPLPTEVRQGNDLAQLSADILGSYQQPWPWSTFESYASCVDACKPLTHLIVLQAHAPLRLAALHQEVNRAATESEIAQMCEMLEQSYDSGAAGFSTGLYYAPCQFAAKEELRELLQITAARDKLFAVHHRCEGDGIMASLRGVLDIALEVGVRCEISHLKVIGARSQFLVPAILDLLEAYEMAGLDIGFDQYPYTYGSTSLYSLLPPACLKIPRTELASRIKDPRQRSSIRKQMLEPDGWDSIVSLCGWDNISVVHVDGRPEMTGKRWSELADSAHCSEFDLLFDVLADLPETAVMSDITQSEDSVSTILQHRLGCFGTDALYSSEITHPRSHRAVQDLFDRYYCQLQLCEIERLVARMTSYPAQRLRLQGRGCIEPGYTADLIGFTVDASGFAIQMVITDGGPVLLDRVLTGKSTGGVLRSRIG